jgi:hypothetical protein
MGMSHLDPELIQKVLAQGALCRPNEHATIVDKFRGVTLMDVE